MSGIIQGFLASIQNIITLLFDAAKTSSYTTLSNSNRTVTANSYYHAGPSIGTRSIGSEKIMFSFTLDIFSGHTLGDSIGIANNSFSSSENLGRDVNSIGFYSNGSCYYDSNIAGTSVDFQNDGNILDVCVDNVNHSIWIRVDGGNWNADVSANPSTNNLGISFSLGEGSVYPVAAPLNYNYNGQFTINQTPTYSTPTFFTFI